MRRIMAAWRQIANDFSWAVLLLVLVYSLVSIVMGMQSPNLIPDTISSLIRGVFWLTIIAVMVPQNNTPIPVRRPFPELIYLIVWVILDAAAVVYFYNALSPDSPYREIVRDVIVLFALIGPAVLFGSVFRYSVKELGIPFKHWRLYLALIIIGFFVGQHLLLGMFHMLIGAISLLLLLGLDLPLVWWTGR